MVNATVKVEGPVPVLTARAHAVVKLENHVPAVIAVRVHVAARLAASVLAVKGVSAPRQPAPRQRPSPDAALHRLLRQLVADLKRKRRVIVKPQVNVGVDQLASANELFKNSIKIKTY